MLELLADGELSAGEVGEVIQREFGISQPAVSQHLRVLRESGFTTVRADGARRLYAVDPSPLAAADAWFDPFRRFWQPHLDALGTELARGAGAHAEEDGRRRPAPRPRRPMTTDPERGEVRWSM